MWEQLTEHLDQSLTGPDPAAQSQVAELSVRTLADRHTLLV